MWSTETCNGIYYCCVILPCVSMHAHNEVTIKLYCTYISISLPGYDRFTNSSKFWLPFSVDNPISIRPVAATSNKQKTSSPHVSIACCSNAVSEKVGSNIGSKFGS